MCVIISLYLNNIQLVILMVVILSSFVIEKLFKTKFEEVADEFVCVSD